MTAIDASTISDRENGATGIIATLEEAPTKVEVEMSVRDRAEAVEGTETEVTVVIHTTDGETTIAQGRITGTGIGETIGTETEVARGLVLALHQDEDGPRATTTTRTIGHQSIEKVDQDLGAGRAARLAGGLDAVCRVVEALRQLARNNEGPHLDRLPFLPRAFWAVLHYPCDYVGLSVVTMSHRWVRSGKYELPVRSSS